MDQAVYEGIELIEWALSEGMQSWVSAGSVAVISIPIKTLEH